MLPEIALDDVRFQELVSEARTRIVRHAPDWTEHNVSDPGITLIELFAWLTEILSYRINRIPPRLYLALLGLVGMAPGEPQAAVVDLRFMLAAAGAADPLGLGIDAAKANAGPVAAVLVPAGTEVASPRATGGEPIVFQTSEDLEIAQRGLLAACLECDGGVSPMLLHGDRATPSEAPAPMFADPHAAGAALLLGFDQSIARMVLRVGFDCSLAEARDLDPAAPPLAWEVSAADGGWLPASVLSDETGAFLLGSGAITVQCPPGAAAANLGGRELHWLRLRLLDAGSELTRPRYVRAPQIAAVKVAVAGAVISAGHACTVAGELIGYSDGVAGSTYPLQQRPVLPLGAGETLEVRERGAADWVAWQRVDSFALSGPYDRHFALDRTAGEVRFGPAIRQPDGGWRRFGAVPGGGAAMRFSRYRHGGGIAGNVAARTLRVMPVRIGGIESVSNPRAAAGGVDAESLQSVSARARIDVRARTRAVTAEDFEALTRAASSEVARALCVAREPGRPIRIHVLPRVEPADRRLEPAELTPSPRLMQVLATALDDKRLLGTSIRLLPVRFKGVSVVVDLRASPRADLERVQFDVEHALYIFLNPLIGGSPEGPGAGWGRGRALNQGELFGIVYGIEGVEFVNILRVYETDMRTGEQAPKPTESQLPVAADELIASGRHIVKASHRE